VTPPRNCAFRERCPFARKRHLLTKWLKLGVHGAAGS